MSSTPVIKCDSVYKIFGANAKKMLQDVMEMLMPKLSKRLVAL